MVYFGIYDERRVVNLPLKGKNTILIRIFDPNKNSSEYPPILNFSSYKTILELSLFDYVTPPKLHELDDTFKKINEFILKNNFDEIIIHCSLGISRSPAIMICVAKILNNINLEQTVKEKFKYYNRFIVESFENYPYVIKSGISNEKFECINQETISTKKFDFGGIIVDCNKTQEDTRDIKKKIKIKNYFEEN